MTESEFEAPVWLFAYGSLIYHIDFPVLEQCRASITSWQRRFWQGSHDHRGTPETPGRVVTLYPAPGEICIGLALRVEPDVFTHLDYREKNGYERYSVPIVLDSGEAVDGLVYIAESGNFAWLGEDSPEQIAVEIVSSHGPSGSNLDYLLNLEEALQKLGTHDAHITELAELVRGQSFTSGSKS